MAISKVDSIPSNDKIAFLGPPSGGDKIRSEINLLELHNVANYLCDLGNYTSAGSKILVEIIREFVESGQKLVCCLSHKIEENVKEVLPSTFLQTVFISNTPEIRYQDQTYLGIQRHLTPPGFDMDATKHIPLGALRCNIENAEVVMRNAECVWVDLNVLKYSENLGSMSSSAAGLTIEELCMITKYVGASNNLKVLFLVGYDENSDPFGMSRKNLASLLWYLLEGFGIRLAELKTTVDFQEYTVVPENSTAELVFIEDRRSGRWWVELFSEEADKDVRVACTRQDYVDACNNRISDRITSLITHI